MNSDLIDEAFPIVRTRDRIENVQRTIRSENLRLSDLAKKPEETTDLPAKLRREEYIRESNRKAIDKEIQLISAEVMTPYPSGEGFKFEDIDIWHNSIAVDRNTADLITGGQWSTRIDSWWDHEITYSDPEPTRSQRLWAWIKKGFQNE